MTAYTGGCTCGAIRYEIAAEPVRGFHCQCRDCQKDTGAGHASVAVFPRAAMKLTGEVVENPRTATAAPRSARDFAAIADRRSTTSRKTCPT